MQRVFAIDVLLCPSCGGGMEAIAEITEQWRRHQRAGTGETPNAARSIARQLGDERPHIGDPPIGIHREPRQQRLSQPPGDPPARRLDDVPTQHVRRDLHDGPAAERTLAIHRLPQRNAERVHVAAHVDRLAQVLLGRHVHRRAHHVARRGEVQLERARRNPFTRGV